jgi:HAD superfamily hydrolase (TIGR01458 family)
MALGPGPFVTALEYACDVQAKVIGKPSPTFFGMVIQDMKLDPSEIVMIGDDVRDDCGGALKVGCSSILVQTGKYKEGDERNKGVSPTLTFQNFAEAVDYLLQL